MTRWEIKERLGHGGAARIAKRTRRSHGHVSQVISGARRDPVVERNIAKRIGLPVEEVFGPPPVRESSPAREPAPDVEAATQVA